MFGIFMQIVNNMKYVVSRIAVIGVFVITAVAVGVIGLVIVVAAVVVDVVVVVIFTFQFPDIGSSLMVLSSNSGRQDPSPQSTTAVWMTR